MASGLISRTLSNSGSRLIRIGEGLSDFQASLLIGMLSFLARSAVMAVAHLQVETTESVNVAMSLAKHGTFSDPYQTAVTGPTAHLAPIYPFLLSLIYTMFGTGSQLARRMFANALVSLQYALLPQAGRAFGLPRIVGLTAGIAAALLPARMWVETSGGHETALASLAAIWLIPLTIRIVNAGPALAKQILLGIAWGVAFLINPVLALVLTGILLVLVLDSGAWRIAPVILCFAGLSTLPWIARDYIVFGKFIPIRDNFGLELAVSNNDAATALMDRNSASPVFIHPFKDVEEGRKMQAMGEIAYYHSRQEEAIAWIKSHPSRFAQLTAQRLVFFWFSPVADTAKNVFLGLLTAGGFVGLYLLFGQQQRSASLILTIWVAYQIPYYFVQVSPRYRFPIDWTFWLMAGYVGWRLFDHGAKPKVRPAVE